MNHGMIGPIHSRFKNFLVLHWRHIDVTDGSSCSISMKKKGDPDGREEGGAKKGGGEGVKNQVAELQMHNNGVNNVSEDGAKNGTNSNSNGHARHVNGCGQRTAGSVHPTNGSHHSTNGSYANPLNASALPTQSSASNLTPHLLPTYPWDNESDEER